jgi:deoxyribodipyrimidine photo-lyase
MVFLGDPIWWGVRKDVMTQTELFSNTKAQRAHIDWTPTRAAGLARLEAFLPFAGAAYARTRNTDFGPNDRSNVSALSPWLSRRILTEQEVVAAVMSAHGFDNAQKFIQEVFWRTYWKGWLQMRPGVLVTFNQERQALHQTVPLDSALSRRLAKAMDGRSGIACFDAWVGELRDLGWLHNHARMWFASIWIFTLGLPWQLGADFFYKHLLDADAASNTLSWRWVAGLHTKGKHYIARASNIAIHSNDRFDPAKMLNESALPLTETYQVPGPMALPTPKPVSADKVGLLLTQEDLHPQSWPLFAQVVGAASLAMPPIGEVDSPQHRFTHGALEDGRERAHQSFGVDALPLTTTNDVVIWAKDLGVRQVVTGYAPTGLVAWRLQDIVSELAKHEIELVHIKREWDQRAWPLATGGFFKLKEKLPTLIRELVTA